MTLKRICYTSEVVKSHEVGIQRIHAQSVRNNAVQGITGVLLQYGGEYLQVIEGEERDVDALTERLRADRRHRRMRIWLTEYTDTRLFDAWSMGLPSLSDQQLRFTMRLIKSEQTSSQEVGLTYLRYWLTSHTVAADITFHKSSLRVGDLEGVVSSEHQSRNFAVILFCAAVLLGVLVDAAFFLSEYFDGLAGSLSMLQSYAIAAPGLLLSMWYAYKGDASRGVSVFQGTAFITISLHALWAGYGIYAPTLPYLGAAIATGALSHRQDNGFKFGAASVILVAVAAFLSLSGSTSPHFTNTVAPHHATLTGLIFPILCILILNAHNKDRSAAEKFAAAVLADLTDTVAALKKSMAARNYFFSAISHEIRTPMNGAISAVTLIEHPKASPEVKARSTSALRQSLSNLNRLLNDLLDISKLESGKFELANAPFDINESTRNVIEFFTPAVEEGGNSISLTLLPTQTLLQGDQQRYEQMLSNFVGNAIKFTKSGRIAVTLRLLEHTASPGTSLWRCEVADSGIGIAPEEVQKLFQPFSQASQNGFSATKGTGLGLAIVAALAKQMDGDVGVESVEGKGSTFWFTFSMPIFEQVAT